jgi:site-specific recombinase XerD
MTDLQVIENGGNRQLTIYEASAQRYEIRRKAENTKRAYRSAWADFQTWCKQAGFDALPANIEAVRYYLADLADKGKSVSTIEVRRAAISAAHVAARCATDPTHHPDVKELMEGITRVLGKGGDKKEPITLDVLGRIVGAIDAATIRGKRDKALILLGYAGAFRRSELVAIDVAHVRIIGHIKLIVHIAKSKTDQEGEGTKKYIPRIADPAICPVAAYWDYVDAAGIASGPMFRRLDRGGHITDKRLSAQSVALIVKRYAEAAGLDWRNLSGHSLRAGYVTESHGAGADGADIMAQTGHKKDETLRGYIRDRGAGAERATRAAFGET